MADKKRINWVALSAFCYRFGVLFALSVSVALTRNSSVVSVRSDLFATEAARRNSPERPRRRACSTDFTRGCPSAGVDPARKPAAPG